MSVFFTRRGKAAERVNYVDSIAATGTQYLDTKIKSPSNNLRIVCEYTYTSVAANQSIFGAQTFSGAPYKYSMIPFLGSDGVQGMYVGQTPNLLPLTVVAGKKYRFEFIAKDNVVTRIVDGVAESASYAGSLDTAYNIFVFAQNVSGSPYAPLSSGLLHLYQIYIDDVLVLDYRPCFDPDGVACVYDRVNEEYNYNAGTGEFIAGIIVPSELQLLGTVYINGEIVKTAAGYDTVEDAIYKAVVLPTPPTSKTTISYTTLSAISGGEATGIMAYSNFMVYASKTAAQEFEQAAVADGGAEKAFNGISSGNYLMIATENFGAVQYYAYVFQ